MYIKLMVLMLCPIAAFSQNSLFKDQNWAFPAGIVNTQSNHPFGLWMSRINHQTGQIKNQTPSIQWTTSAGNVWLPSVEGHQPIHHQDQQHFSALLWHERATHFDPDESPSQSMMLHVDGVFKNQTASLLLPIGQLTNFELTIKSFFFEPGARPLNVITGDHFIEWFHTNIAQDEDPFARKHYGFDQAAFRYRDKSGREMELKPNQRYFSGFEAKFARTILMPHLNKKNWHFNTGLHIGFNTNNFFPGLDLGCQGAVSKEWSINDKQKVQIGQSLGVMAPRLVQVNKAMEMTSRRLIYSQETNLKWARKNRNGTYLVLSTSYFIQASYFKKTDMDALILTGKRYTSHWHYSISHLFRKLTANNFIIEYHFRGQSIGCYLREDLLVDNAPDIQIGAVYRIPI